MMKAKVRCVGISPLLMDKMSDKTLESLRTGARDQVQKDVPAEKVCEDKIYREDGDEGAIGIPVDMFMGALVNAGRKVKIGKNQVSTAGSTMIFDLLSIDEAFLPLLSVKNGQEKKSWIVDKRRGVGQTGVAVCVVRPKFKHWEFEVTVRFNEKKVSESTIRALFADAGSAQGIGSFRPNKKGPFGRFEVKTWESEKIEGALEDLEEGETGEGEDGDEAGAEAVGAGAGQSA